MIEADFDYPGGPDQASLDDVPSDVRTAFEMHRHWNLDFVLTCQNLSQLHELIKNTAEMAHHHQNLASVITFMKGHYVVRSHPADTYLAEKNIILQRNRTIQKWVFDLYKSTATGVVSDTNTGTSLWRNPAIAVPVGGFVLCLLYLLIFAKIPFIGKDHPGDKKVGVSSGAVASGGGVSPDSSASHADSGAGHPSIPVHASFHKASDLSNELFLAGFWGGKAHFEVVTADETNGVLHSQDTLEKIGYKVEIIDKCLVKLTFNEVNEYVRCRSTQVDNKKSGIL